MARLAVIGSPYTTIPDGKNGMLFKLLHLSEHHVLIAIVDGFVHLFDQGAAQGASERS